MALGRSSWQKGLFVSSCSEQFSGHVNRGILRNIGHKIDPTKNKMACCGNSVLLQLFTVFLMFMGWYFSSNGREEGQIPRTDWVHSVVFDPKRILAPSSLDEIVTIASSANENGRKIRVLGSGHSWSPITTSNDISLSLFNYKGVIAVDTHRRLVTVKGGTTLREATTFLREKGFALHLVPSVSTQTVVGAIMTATHATGVSHCNLATLVTEFELVLANGTVTVISKETNSDLFHASVVSVGLLGVVTQVTMTIEPDFNLHETLTPHPLKYCLDNPRKVFESSQHTKMWIEWHSQTCAVFRVNRTLEEPRDNFNPTVMAIKGRVFEVIQWLCTALPYSVGRAVMAMLVGSGEVFPPHDRVDTYDGIFNLPYYQVMDTEAELAFDIDDCTLALNTLKRVIDDTGITVNIITEIRTVKEDDLWLSMNYKQTSCQVTQLLYLPTAEERVKYFDGFFEQTRQLNGRPHWGKLFRTNSKEMKRLYPKMEQFLVLRSELDPKRVFVNDFLDKLFPNK